MKLLIVESPAKAKTIGKYLGDGFVVKSSVGHVRDLPKKGGGLAIAIEPSPRTCKQGPWTFTPSYEISAEKKKVVDDLKRAAKQADEIYLAPDPDREGEAIAWHLHEVLAPVAAKKPFHRVTYNEITKSAVAAAVANPGEIDLQRVDAQQARRVLDRIVGYGVSPLLWRALNYGHSLSAGRVQSVALRLLVEREREIQGFKPEAYWLMGVEARKRGDAAFAARLARFDGAKPAVKDAQTAQAMLDDLAGAALRVAKVVKMPKTRHAFPPFTTSTLQQSASGACGFSPSRTMSIAQKLYEEGLITYMRTDSVNVAQVALDQVRGFIGGTYGAAFVPAVPNRYKSKAGAQEAHEAIRPTDCTKLPGTLGLDAAADKLYRLVWNRFVASQMTEARLEQTTVALEPVKDGLRHAYQFSASTTEIVFEGFLKVAGTSLVKKSAAKDKDGEDDETDEVRQLPALAEGDALDVVRWLSEAKETKPPARFSEATLVKQLEENGVGRPSTYAQTIEVLVKRAYAEREARQLVPTQRGMDVCDWLVKKMPDLFDVGYTADMEARLDQVEAGGVSGQTMLSDFYRTFLESLAKAKDPPADAAKFAPLFALLDCVKTWKEPVQIGKRKFSDAAFVESVKEQVSSAPERLSEKQLQTLVRLCVAYADQIPDCEAKLVEAGWADALAKIKDAPDPELVKWCFETLDRVEGRSRSAFVESVRQQFERGRALSAKQFAALTRMVGENARGLADCDAVRARLAPYVPEGFVDGEADPAVPGLFQLAAAIKTWKEPVRRVRRVYDDKAFLDSLAQQWRSRHVLSARQVAALRRVVASYRDQIPDYAQAAGPLGLNAVPARKSAARKTAAATAKAAQT